MRLLPATLLGLLLLGSCALPLREDGTIQTYAAVPAEQLVGQSFSWAGASDADMDMAEASLYQQVARELEARGLHQAITGESPSLAIHLLLQQEQVEVEIPAHISNRRSFRQGPLIPITVCDANGRVTTRWSYASGYWYDVPVTVSPQKVTRYRLYLGLTMKDAEGKALWKGTIDTLARAPDLKGRMQAWIPVLLEEFPTPQEGIGERTVTVGL